MSSSSLIENVGRWAGCCAVLAACWMTSTALADSRTVQLKGGGFVQGEVMEATPGQSVRVQMADGSVREIPWTDIERIDAPAPQPVPAPVPPPVYQQAQPGFAVQLAPPSPYAAEIAALEEERRQIGIGGPITMLAVGAGAAVIMVSYGLSFWLLTSARCNDVDGDGCDNGFDWVGPTLLVGAAIAAVIAIWGAIELGDRLGERGALRAKIKELHAGHPVASLDFRARAGAGALELTLRF